MPRIARRLVQASLAYLALGFTLGAMLLFNKGVPLAPGLARLLPAHIEFLLVGWVIQLVMGVATWILPRFGVSRSAYGSAAAGWAAFALINTGVWLAAIGPLVAGPIGLVLLMSGRLAETAAAVVFAGSTWARVRASGMSPM